MNPGIASEPCPACGALTTEPLFWKPAGSEFARRGPGPVGAEGASIVGCTVCGLGKVDPMPTAAELDALYAADYFRPDVFSGRVSDPLVHPTRETSGPPALQAVREASQRRYERAHVARLGAWYGRLAGHTPPPRFLDVGCGTGGVLAAATELGWRAEGVEPAGAAVALARQRGLKVAHGTLTDADYPADSFDLVHIREVLEHVPDPHGLLTEAWRVVRRGGLVYVQVPNDLEGYRRWVFPRVWWLIPPLHLWYFTFGSLERLLGKVGFRPRVRGTLGLGVGADAYRYLGARLGVLGWLDSNEDGRWALVPRAVRAAVKVSASPADRVLNRARRHSSLWICAVLD